MGTKTPERKEREKEVALINRTFKKVQKILGLSVVLWTKDRRSKERDRTSGSTNPDNELKVNDPRIDSGLVVYAVADTCWLCSLLGDLHLSLPWSLQSSALSFICRPEATLSTLC